MRYLLPLMLALVATPALAQDAGVVTAKDWEDALGFTATEQVVVVLEDVLEIEHKVEEDAEHLVEETDDLLSTTAVLAQPSGDSEVQVQVEDWNHHFGFDTAEELIVEMEEAVGAPATERAPAVTFELPPKVVEIPESTFHLLEFVWVACVLGLMLLLVRMATK